MEKDLLSWTKPQLQAQLRKLKLKLSGNKPDLIKRIRDHEASKYANMKVPKLKSLLKERKLSQTGNKADLVKRLDDSDIKKTRESPSPKRPSLKKAPQRIFAGAPELNFQIFLHLDDKSLAKACKTSKEAVEICEDDYFWIKRIERVFGYDLGKYNVGQVSYRIIYNFFKKHSRRSIDLKLLAAVKAGYFSIVHYLIEEQDANIYYSYVENEFVLLEEAVRAGHLLIVKYLEKIGEYNLDVALRTDATWKNFEIAKFLIEKGADIYKVQIDDDIDDDTNAFTMAATFGALNILKYMINHKTPDDENLNNAFFGAAESGELPVVKYLMEEQGVTADLNNAIVNAAFDGNLKIIKYLVEKGGDIHFNNDAALHNAEKQEYDNIVRYRRGSPKKRVKRRTIPT